jgi:hypothetical protein
MNALKIFILLILIGAFSTNYAVAQFFVEVGSGYAMPIKNIDRFGTKNSPVSIYINYMWIDCEASNPRANNMNGLFFSGEAGYRFKNNFALSLNFQYLNNNKIKFLYSELTRTYRYEDITITELPFFDCISKTEETIIFNNPISGKYFSFSPKFSYIFTIKNLEIQPAIGISYTNAKSYVDFKYENYIKETSYTPINPVKDTFSSYGIEVLEYKYRYFRPFLFSAYFSLSLNYKFNKNFSAFFLTEFNGLRLFYFLKRDMFMTIGEQYYYKRSGYTRRDDGTESPQQIVEDFTVIPIYGVGLPPRKQYGTGYTNLNFSIGVRYTFNNRQKKD